MYKNNRLFKTYRTHYHFMAINRAHLIDDKEICIILKIQRRKNKNISTRHILEQHKIRFQNLPSTLFFHFQ